MTFGKPEKCINLISIIYMFQELLIDNSVTKVILIPLSYIRFIHMFTSPSAKVSLLTRGDSLLGCSFSDFAQSSLKTHCQFNHLPVMKQF